MNRNIIKTFELALLSLSIAVSSHNAVKAADKPSFLLVVADDMGWTDLGCFGSEIETPHFDALAARGVRFTDFHVSVSCSPTRSMLLTGTDNHIAGLGNMGELITPAQEGKPGYEGHLNNQVVSLAEILRSAGYHTYMAGKWHLGHEPGQYPCDRGFDRAFSLLYGGASHFGDRFGLMESESPAKYTRNGRELQELPDDFYSSRSYADFLMQAIREQYDDGRPFLAYLAFTAPHDPIHVPEPWLSKYRGQYEGGYETLKEQRADGAKRLGLVPETADVPGPHEMMKRWDSLSEAERAESQRGMEGYAAMIDNMDYHFGRVVHFLKDIGAYDNTIIIFLSDNGSNPWSSEDYPGNRDSDWFSRFDNSAGNIGHPGSNYAYGIGWASASSGPLDYFKMAVGEGGIRSPAIIAGPGINGARQLLSFAHVWDVVPTILDFSGLNHPAESGQSEVQPVRGRSLMPVLNGSADETYDADAHIAGEMGSGKWIRQGDVKAVSVAQPYGPASWQLFDVRSDPGETRDLSLDEPELLRKLVTAWDRYAADVGVVAGE